MNGGLFANKSTLLQMAEKGIEIPLTIHAIVIITNNYS